MASTWAGTAGTEFVTRAAIYDLIENVGEAAWSGAAPVGWSSSGRWVTWSELHAYVELEPGAPGEDTANGGDPSIDPYWDRWPARNDMVTWLSDPAPPAPTQQPTGLSLVGLSGGIIRVTWTNTTSAYNMRVTFTCVTNPITYPAIVIDPVAGGTTQVQTQITNFDPETWQAAIYYYNESGAGPTSTSNQLEWSTQH